MHFVIYLPSAFYAAMAATMIETLQAVNDVAQREVFTFEFVSGKGRSVSKSGIAFPAHSRPTRKIDVLILLAGSAPEVPDTLRLLEEETKRAAPLIAQAVDDGARIATTCAAAYLLAGVGLLDGKRATISWWLKREAQVRFPAVRWEPSRMIVREDRLYTTGASFAGLELIALLLIDLGFAEEERQVRKLLLFPPTRLFQSPYEDIPATEGDSLFVRQVEEFATQNLRDFDLKRLACHLGLSPRTMARRFAEELQMTPGKWVQERRLAAARSLLQGSEWNISEICYQVGYQDTASFSRLFARKTGMAPGEYRKQIASRASDRSAI